MPKSASKKYPSEHVEQCDFVLWFRMFHQDVLIFAIPNGGKRNIVTAKKLKAEGVEPGIPDLYIPAWKLWVEMKSKTGGLSTDQKEKIEYLKSIGDSVIVAYGYEDAKEQIEAFRKRVNEELMFYGRKPI